MKSKQIIYLQKQTKDEKNQFQKISESLKNESSEQYKSLKRKYDRLKKKYFHMVEETTQKINTLNDENSKLTKKNISNFSDIQFSSDDNNYQKQLLESRVINLKEKLGNITNEKKSILMENERLRKNIHDLENQVKSLVLSVKKKIENFRSTKVERATLDGKIMKLKRVVEEKENKIRNLKEKVRLIKGENNNKNLEMTTGMSKIIDENVKLKEKVNEMKFLIAKIQEENKINEKKLLNYNSNFTNKVRGVKYEKEELEKRERSLKFAFDRQRQKFLFQKEKLNEIEIKIRGEMRRLSKRNKLLTRENIELSKKVVVVKNALLEEKQDLKNELVGKEKLINILHQKMDILVEEKENNQRKDNLRYKELESTIHENNLNETQNISRIFDHNNSMVSEMNTLKDFNLKLQLQNEQMRNKMVVLQNNLEVIKDRIREDMNERDRVNEESLSNVKEKFQVLLEQRDKIIYEKDKIVHCLVDKLFEKRLYVLKRKAFETWRKQTVKQLVCSKKIQTKIIKTFPKGVQTNFVDNIIHKPNLVLQNENITQPSANNSNNIPIYQYGRNLSTFVELPMKLKMNENKRIPISPLKIVQLQPKIIIENQKESKENLGNLGVRYVSPTYVDNVNEENDNKCKEVILEKAGERNNEFVESNVILENAGERNNEIVESNKVIEIDKFFEKKKKKRRRKKRKSKMKKKLISPKKTQSPRNMKIRIISGPPSKMQELESLLMRKKNNFKCKISSFSNTNPWIPPPALTSPLTKSFQN